MKIIWVPFLLLIATTMALGADLERGVPPSNITAGTCRSYLDQRQYLPSDTAARRKFLQSADRFCSLSENVDKSPIASWEVKDSFVCTSAFYDCVATGFYYWACVAWWCGFP